MKIREFRLFTADDPFDGTPNWSRRYEWRYVLDRLAEDPTLQSIHNSCCGPDAIHRFFADKLARLGRSVVHSDIEETEENRKLPGFFRYSILEPLGKTFDCVLCISTLEELREPELIRRAFGNLLEQTRPGGRLLITCDLPDVPLEVLEEIAGRKIGRQGRLLSGATSTYPDPRFAHLNIALLDIER